MIPAATAALTSTIACQSSEAIPSVDRLAAAELLSSTRALPPAGFVVRTVASERLALTKVSEGWIPYRYNDAAKYCTIGYGHLIKKSACDGSEPKEFLRRLTEPRGEQLLAGDMTSARYTVMTSVDVPLTDGQFAALSDFVFNIGTRNFAHSTLLKVINDEEEERVPGQLRRWVLAGGKPWPGLVKRREQEINMYFEGRKVRAVPAPGEDLSPLDIMSDDTQGH